MYINNLKKTQMNSKKFGEILQIIGGISIFTLMVSVFLSAEQKDLRYVATGIIIFSICYFGGMALHFSLIIKERRNPVDNIMEIVFSLFLWLSMAIPLLLYGISLFLHHYDIDELYNLFLILFKKINSLKF